MLCTLTVLCRYGTYQLVQKMPGGDQLVAFTRILHRTKPDVLVDEVGSPEARASGSVQPAWPIQNLRPSCCMHAGCWPAAAPQLPASHTLLQRASERCSQWAGDAEAKRLLQVPSWQAQPLTPACDQWCEFPVSDRPNAVAQWLQAAAKQPALIKARCPPVGLRPIHTDQTSLSWACSLRINVPPCQAGIWQCTICSCRLACTGVPHCSSGPQAAGPGPVPVRLRAPAGSMPGQAMLPAGVCSPHAMPW